MISNFQKPAGIVWRLVIFILAFGISQAAFAAEKTVAPAPVPEKTEEPAPVKDLADLIPYVTGLSQRLTDFQRQSESFFNTADIQDELVKLSEKIEDLSWDVTFLKSGGHHSYEELAYLKKAVTWRELKIKEISKPLNQSVKLINTWRNEWIAEQKRLAEWQVVVDSQDSMPEGARAFENYKETIDRATQLVARQLKPLLDTDQKVGDLQVKIHALGLEIDNRMRAMHKAGFQKNSPSMISREFYAQYTRELWTMVWRGAMSATHIRFSDSGVGGWVLIPVLIALAVLSLLIYRSGRFLTEDAKWYTFARRPVATCVLICIPLIVAFLVNFPPSWFTVMRIVMLVAALRLARELLLDVWKKRIFTQVTVLLLISGVFSIISLPMILYRMYVLIISSMGLTLCLWHGWLNIKSSEAKLVVWAFRMGALVMSCTLITEASGYSTFAFFLFTAFLRTVFLTVVVWILVLVVNGVIEMLLTKSPVPFVQRNASAIVRRLNPLIIFSFAIFITVSLLVVWRLFTTEWDALLALLSYGFDLGSQRITFGLILSVFAILYGSVLISRAIQAVLLQSVLQRQKVEKGVQFSIARLVHYGIVTVGFLIALHALGIGTTNLTIMGSALGVGIGFGLQAIVSNFVSGLILLFERPIKVGDTIQLGDQMGEVRNLGLRATVIQTYDSAEIVVPNSDLITGQLTNWTLGERRVRAKIPVGVAYGSDVARVMGLLMSCANENERVLKDPAPQVLFLAFGASSLDFELRVWIDDFNDRMTVKSEVNQAIELKLRKAGIEIPFPQQDVNLKSLPEAFISNLKTTDKAD